MTTAIILSFILFVLGAYGLTLWSDCYQTKVSAMGNDLSKRMESVENKCEELLMIVSNTLIDDGISDEDMTRLRGMMSGLDSPKQSRR